MKIYGHPWSINTRKVLVALEEKNQHMDLVLVDLPNFANRSPEHVARHPFAKVPVLEEDDGVLLYETQAILRYLDRKLAGARLIPESARAAGRVDQWLGVAASYFEEHAHRAIVEALFKRIRGLGEPDPQLMAQHRASLGPALDVADGELAKSKFLAGDQFTLADLVWMPYLEYLSRAGLDDLITTRKNVAGWWERLGSRPSWIKVGRTGEQPPSFGRTK